MTKTDLAKRIGARVRERREGRGWSHRELADRVGTYRPIVWRVERGTHTPSLFTLWHYAQALGVPLTDIVSAVDETEDVVHGMHMRDATERQGARPANGAGRELPLSEVGRG